MVLFTLFLTAIGLAMDAFAVSLATGMANPRLPAREGLRMALCFGGFQAFMPLLGASLGAAVIALAGDSVRAWDHWVALVLLAGVGGKMLHQAWSSEVAAPARLSTGALLILGFATSIDALAAGLTLDVMGIGRTLGVTVIGLVTFAVCWPAAAVGARCGARLAVLGPRLARSTAFLGGAMLVLVGLRIVFDHLAHGI